MRNALALGALLALAAGATASAADSWQISGALARACQISFDCADGDQCRSLTLDDRVTVQNTATVTWQCNYAIEAATMDFSSENQGLLVNPDDDLGLPYLATYTGGQNSGFAGRSLVTHVITNPTPDTPNVDVSGSIQLMLQARTQPLFAGRYSDRITVTITPEAP